MIGDFFTGSTMVAGDADTDVDPFHRTITGRTRFSGALLYLSPRFARAITGKTTLSATISFAPHPHLSSEVVGHSDLSDSTLFGGHQLLEAFLVGKTILSATLSIASAPHLSGSIVGATRFTAPAFAVARVLDFQGEVAAQAERSLVTHGEVLSGTGAVFPTPYEDERQPVPHFV